MSYSITPPSSEQSVQIIAPDGTVLVEIRCRDGKVTLHDSTRVDEAAELFWQAVQIAGGYRGGPPVKPKDVLWNALLASVER